MRIARLVDYWQWNVRSCEHMRVVRQSWWSMISVYLQNDAPQLVDSDRHQLL